MKSPLIVFWGCALVAATALPGNSQVCAPAIISAKVEVTGTEFSLADLLAPGACPALRRAAAEIRMGRTAPVGSARVLSGDEVRGLLQRLPRNVSRDPESDFPSGVLASASPMALERITVPERITIRHTGARSSCAQIVERLFPSVSSPAVASPGSPPLPAVFDLSSSSNFPSSFNLPPGAACDAAVNVPENAAV